VDHMASVTGRLGYTWGRALIYAKGGWTGGDVAALASSNAGTPFLPSNTPVNGETKWLNGWTVGGGIEFALTNTWSAKAEYMYYDLGEASYVVGPTPIDVDTRGNSVRVGLNYHFNMMREPMPLK